MKKIIILVVLFLFSSNFLKEEARGEEIKIPDCFESLSVIKFSEDERASIVLSKDGRIFVSQDQSSWSDVLRVGFIEKITDVEIITDKRIFAVGDNGLAITTTDGGVSWTQILNLPKKNFTKVKFVNQYLFILGEAGTVLRSNDFGNSFQNFSVNTIGSFRDITFKKATDLGFMVSDQEPGLWISIYGGSNWESRDLPQEAIGTHITIDGKTLYITGLGYMGFEYQSPLILRINSEDLNDWMVTPLPESFIPTGVAIKNGKGAAIMNKSTGQVWRAIFSGVSWIPQQINKMLYSIAMREESIFIASDNGTIIKLDLTVGVSPINSEIPSVYILRQNYPNPFNPTTKINFSIPISGKVKLAIYNIVGQEITVLLNQNLTVGNYSYDFDATSLTSGVYFYTLRSENFSSTKRMALIK